ncbi:MAG: 23S rRNA (guanosine(2251)-2'-O)-methyltransferase RlmB [Burkholderiales bacterium]|jgi:23S rRNA (guanosine2251-2'-O)-methyltransferase|nr:23S rRNA (guanosine(2251)-2'-O)-methyltransferase RlmB [Burkholderiales bacterium]
MNHDEKTWIFGFHAVIARLRQRPESVTHIYFDESRKDPRAKDVLSRAKLAGCPVEATDKATLDQKTLSGRHQGIVAQVKNIASALTLDEILSGTTTPFLLVLDEVTDPHNLGACLRSADVFGVDAVILPKDRSVGITPVVSKVSCGAAETVPVIFVTNLSRALDQMKASGVWCVAADMDGENLYDADLTGPMAWVLGAEGRGLRRLTREKCDRVVSIPMLGSVESLNVSVAAGICLSATRMSRHRAGTPTLTGNLTKHVG